MKGKGWSQFISELPDLLHCMDVKKSEILEWFSYFHISSTSLDADILGYILQQLILSTVCKQYFITR